MFSRHRIVATRRPITTSLVAVVVRAGASLVCGAPGAEVAKRKERCRHFQVRSKHPYARRFVHSLGI